MVDRHDANEEIHGLSRKMETITTADANKNSHERSRNSRPMSNVNCSPVNQFKDERQSFKVENCTIGKQLPTINVPEKIVFVIDTAKENDGTPFEFGSGVKLSALNMIKRIIEVFVHAKAAINRKHEYALMMLDKDSTQWVCDLTNNPKRLLTCLERIPETPLNDEQSYYNLSKCFEDIFNKLEIEYNGKTPTSINRVILIYSRSHSLPHWPDVKYFERLVKDPYFFLDSIYVHEPLTDENECEKVYAQLGVLDTKGNSYIFEVGRNSAHIHSTMAKLLAHPLQRPKQNETYYDVCVPQTSQKVITIV